MQSPMVPVSIGEVLDKWVILQIKAGRIKDEAKLENIMTELEALNDIISPYLYGPHGEKARELIEQLTEANEALWEIEDEIRDLEREGIPQKFFVFFNEEGSLDDVEATKVRRFVELARAVYITNDRRCAVKRELNYLLGSEFVEEKSYKEY